ncbi:MAG: OmpH family outer membrane protein [Caulobacterales bacterium]|jgi:outer membrane protein
MMRLFAIMVMALGLVAAPQVAHAQAASSSFVVLDTDTLANTSAAGRSLAAQLQTLQQQMVQEIVSEEQAIQAEARRLAEAAQGQTREQLLSNATLTGQIAANDRRADALRQRAEANNRDFGYTRMQSLNDLNRQLLPIVNEVMASRGAALVVDRSAVISFNPAIDITQEVLTRLDQRVPSVRVTRQTAPAQAQPAAPAR